MSNCKLCLIPGVVPGADLDADGVCAFCRNTDEESYSQAELARADYEIKLEQALEESRGKGEFDALVCLSGGKDSIILLHKLVTEYRLKVLAFTTDMNIPDVAWANIRRTIEALDVDHLVFRPQQDFYRRMYAYLLRNQNDKGAVRTVCYACAPLFESDALRLAVEKNIPLVLAGYSPGQPEPERMVFEFDRAMICDTDWTPPELREAGIFEERELARYWNPFAYPSGTVFPRYIAPFHAWPYDQEANMRKVVELGLVSSRKNASPVHSNCPLNWLLMFSDLKNLGYNPYAPEFAGLIRTGQAKRSTWRLMQPLVNFMIRRRIFLGSQVNESLRWLDLEPEDLRITRPCETTPAAETPKPAPETPKPAERYTAAAE